MSEEKIVIEYEPLDGEFEELFRDLEGQFKDAEIFRSNAASGTELIVLFASSAPLLISKAFDSYLKNKAKIKSAKVKIKNAKNSIEITGMSPKQIEELVESGSIANLKKILDDDK